MSEATGQTPQVPYHPYGVYPPPPPKPGGKTGLIVGGVIGGVVLLVVLVVVIVIVGKSGGGQDGASPGGDAESGEQFEMKYEINTKPCEDIRSDVEDLGVNGSMSASAHEVGDDGGGTAVCSAKLQKFPDDYENYLLFTVDLTVNGEFSSSRFDTLVDQYLGKCDKSEFSGDWDEGTIGACSGETAEATGVVIQDANVGVMMFLAAYENLDISDPEGWLTSRLETMLDGLKANP